MSYMTELCPIIQKTQLTADVYDVVLKAEKLIALARPGQFVHVAIPGKTLRRPISICRIDRQAGTLRLVFQIRGEGTGWMAQAEPGQSFDLLGPLGNGFRLGGLSRKAVFVGGGIGVPPLLEAAASFGSHAVAALGFRSADSVILDEDFARLGCEVRLATDDGSRGTKGLVTQCLEDLTFDIAFACGPSPMLRAVADLCRERGVPCLVSLEERMACGVGACLGCAVKLHGENGPYYGHVCKDGPVFESEKVVWEEIQWRI